MRQGFPARCVLEGRWRRSCEPRGQTPPGAGKAPYTPVCTRFLKKAKKLAWATPGHLFLNTRAPSLPSFLLHARTPQHKREKPHPKGWIDSCTRKSRWDSGMARSRSSNDVPLHRSALHLPCGLRSQSDFSLTGGSGRPGPLAPPPSVPKTESFPAPVIPARARFSPAGTAPSGPVSALIAVSLIAQTWVARSCVDDQGWGQSRPKTCGLAVSGCCFRKRQGWTGQNR